MKQTNKGKKKRTKLEAAYTFLIALASPPHARTRGAGSVHVRTSKRHLELPATHKKTLGLLGPFTTIGAGFMTYLAGDRCGAAHHGVLRPARLHGRGCVQLHAPPHAHHPSRTRHPSRGVCAVCAVCGVPVVPFLSPTSRRVCRVCTRLHLHVARASTSTLHAPPPPRAFARCQPATTHSAISRSIYVGWRPPWVFSAPHARRPECAAPFSEFCEVEI